MALPSYACGMISDTENSNGANYMQVKQPVLSLYFTFPPLVSSIIHISFDLRDIYFIPWVVIPHFVVNIIISLDIVKSFSKFQCPHIYTH